jgi:hypothetical protein
VVATGTNHLVDGSVRRTAFGKPAVFDCREQLVLARKVVEKFIDVIMPESALYKVPPVLADETGLGINQLKHGVDVVKTMVMPAKVTILPLEGVRDPTVVAEFLARTVEFKHPASPLESLLKADPA